MILFVLRHLFKNVDLFVHSWITEPPTGEKNLVPCPSEKPLVQSNVFDHDEKGRESPFPSDISSDILTTETQFQSLRRFSSTSQLDVDLEETYLGKATLKEIDNDDNEGMLSIMIPCLLVPFFVEDHLLLPAQEKSMFKPFTCNQ